VAELGRAYLRDHRVAPVLTAPSAATFAHDQISIRVYFLDDLLKHICRHKTKYRRDLEAVVTYGYMGGSRGGKNGIIRVSGRDTGLVGVAERLPTRRFVLALRRLGLSLDPQSLIEVKVVTHRKNGERIVGVMDRSTGTVVLLETRSYGR